METTQLVLPVNRPVAFHVTSLDVIHSFWAYQLGVKADANPGVDNVAYTTPKQIGGFTVRCSELCGIWHGAMFDYGQVTTPDRLPGVGERRTRPVQQARWPAGRAAALLADLRPHRDPAARRGPGQAGASPARPASTTRRRTR